jgi:type VI secretion system protein ImpF
MAGLKSRERLQPSLLDRLTDHAPTQKRDGPDQQALSMAQLRQAVVRDLTALLNTSNLASLQELSDFPLVARSTLNYGMPGFAGMMDSPSRLVALERAIAEAIETFEPRIGPQTLRVRLSGSRDDVTGTSVVFEIQGELWGQPAPVQLFLETLIEVETRVAMVRERREAR